MSSVSEKIRLAREKSKKRKELLKCTLGSSWAEELGTATKKPKEEKEEATRAPVSSSRTRTSASEERCSLSDFEDSKKCQEEFRDSTAFLKGTQSLNPHNDYSQNFVDTGQRPQNFISE